MRTTIVLETRFSQTPDGVVWSRGWLDSTFWDRYLDVFDAVRVLARVESVASAPPGAKRADAPRVAFAPLPYYVGPWQYAARFFELRRAVRRAIQEQDAVILRVPGTIATLVERELRLRGRPFGVEVVGDPRDVFTTGGVGSVMSPILRWSVPRALRRQCANACAAAYVTEHTLQRRYPPADDAYTTSYSTIDLPDNAYADSPRRPDQPPSAPRFVLVGSLEQLYKGPDVLIRAVQLCARRGVDVHVRIVGDGRRRSDLERLADGLDVRSRVAFVGRVPPGDAVRREIDEADVFVLPSRTEGLPRVLIEAMARGAPCIATDVGGIGELIEGNELVPPDDAEALAKKMIDVAGDAARLARLSAANLTRARRFRADVLRPRRRAFYEHVANATRSSPHPPRREVGTR